jgi:AAA15 family ATPase/GTPase
LEKIKHIEITNFKSIKHLEINDCNKINVFIGQPNAGKSNILEALGLFGGLNSFNRKIEDFIRFGNYNEVFFEENINEVFKIQINESKLFFKSNELSSEEIAISEFISISDSIPLSYLFNNGNGLEESNSNKIIEKICKYNFDNKNYTSRKLNTKNLNFPFGENLVEIISSNPIVRSEIIRLFNLSGLKFLIDKNTNEIKLFKEYQDGTFFTLSYSLIADTLQRLIFYKAAIMSNQNSVLLFEEPEAHCFEPYILEFTNSVKYDENDNQFFIVTHSDYLTKEFLRDEESKENTNIYLVNNVDGETKVKLLDKKKNEDVFEYGMNIFFNFESLWENN